ncbi:aminotransferase class V-fold PLP-dependent enzyme [Niabella sp. CC-SYL272]|uniref:aminotransferase class V-fold PLP-dependent enzyme n=1 Tax=Niabella agricola TaxID=2891571 RepID=UPI001F160E85|nr:aminotransferase class V-fold PLP-dependent enzyme [Niabella agricola]MCF3110556.1 aminotransferase class V-fold PLP-dependent enzyme [Niabella agricola]
MTEHTPPVYLNTAACGLITNPVLQTGIHLYQDFENLASAASEHWRDVKASEIRSNIARFIGTGAENIALIPNFSYGLNAVVQALSGQEKVLLYRKDFPSVYIPFMVNQFNIVWLDDDDGFLIDLNKIESLIKTEKIDLVAISHVQWQSGFKIDLQALCSLCRDLGTRTIIDATQSLGSVKISVAELQPDVFIASNYKWMNAGFGTGILYMSPEFAAAYPPRISGAHSNAFQFADLSFRQNTSITNYEPGSLNMFGFSILDKAIEEKSRRGMEAIEAYNRNLTALLLRQLSVPVTGGADMQHRSSIVVIREENGLHAFLVKNNIITTMRNGNIRISIHFHNTEADIEHLIQCIADHRNA